MSTQWRTSERDKAYMADRRGSIIVLEYKMRSNAQPAPSISKLSVKRVKVFVCNMNNGKDQPRSVRVPWTPRPIQT